MDVAEITQVRRGRVGSQTLLLGLLAQCTTLGIPSTIFKPQMPLLYAELGSQNSHIANLTPDGTVFGGNSSREVMKVK